MKSHTNITLDLNSQNLIEVLDAHQGDKNSRYIDITLTSNGEVLQIDESVTAKYDATINDLVVANDLSAATNIAENIITVELTENMLSKAGLLKIDLKISESNALITAQTFRVKVCRSVINGDSKFTPVGGTIQQAVDEVTAARGDFKSLKSAIEVKADKSEVLFDGDTVFSEVQLGEMQSGYISNTGVQTEHSTFEHTEIIPCEEGEVFKVTATYGFYAPLAVFYDGDGNFIGYDENYYYPSGSKTATDAVITVISGAKGVAFNNRPETTSITVQKRYTEKIPVKVKIAELEKSTANPLVGKTMYADGDSVAEGEGNNKKSYADMIAEKYGMTLVKMAVGGTNLATGNNRANSIYERVTAMTGTYDYILLEGGFNDVFHDVPLGKLTTGYFNDYDTTTVIGAAEGICEYLVTNYFESKKLFVLGHRKFGANAAKQELVWNGIISALEKWGIPYVDIRKETNLCAWTDRFASMYFSGDGTHPNKIGYEQFYVPLIESKLKSL